MSDARVNEFEASGRVVNVRNVYQNKKRVTLFIKGATGRDIYLQVWCDSVPENILRARIECKGHMQTFPIEKDGRTVYRQRFVADEVKKCITMTQEIFGVKGKFAEAGYVRVYLKGTLKSIASTGEKFMRYKIDVGTPHKKTPIAVGGRKLERPIELHVGDTVCCVCAVSTPVKMQDGHRLYYENLIVMDMAKVKVEAKVEAKVE